MRIIILILSFCLIFSGRNLAQNLVPNPSFEECSQCPEGTILEYVNNWFDVCYPSYWVRVLAKCNSNNIYVTPKNWFGFQYPNTGENYIYIATYDYLLNRFYPQVKLKKNLDKKNIILDCIYLCQITQALQYLI